MLSDSVEDSGDLSISLNKSSGEIVVCGEGIHFAIVLASSEALSPDTYVIDVGFWNFNPNWSSRIFSK